MASWAEFHESGITRQATMFAFIELQELQEPLPTDAKLFNNG